jgi:hypothetical protein
MSNRVFFTAMQFKPTNCKDQSGSYGFIAGDDYGLSNVSGNESPEPTDAKEFFMSILSHQDCYDDALDAIIEEALQRGASLDDTFYDAEELKAWYEQFESDE